MNKQLVTVLMPVYNSEKYIATAIQSVLDQTYNHFELLIINDGSTDNTNHIIDRFKDERIIVINQPNKGVASALNTGLQNAKGNFIARFDADDICAANRLEELLKFFENHTNHVVVGSDAEYVLENGEHLFSFKCLGHTHEEIIKLLFFYCPFIHSGVMYKKEAVIRAGGYNIHAHNFEDYLLWTQLRKYGKLANLELPLIKVRFNPSSVTIDEKWRGIEFRKIKRSAIKRGSITPVEGNKLLHIIKSQEDQKFKEGSYYALCGKKFLTDNYQPVKARQQVAKAIRAYPLRLDNYALFLASFFPERFIQWIHQKSPNRL